MCLSLIIICNITDKICSVTSRSPPPKKVQGSDWAAHMVVTIIVNLWLKCVQGCKL